MSETRIDYDTERTRRRSQEVRRTTIEGRIALYQKTLDRLKWFMGLPLAVQLVFEHDSRGQGVTELDLVCMLALHYRDYDKEETSERIKEQLDVRTFGDYVFIRDTTSAKYYHFKEEARQDETSV